MDPLSPETRWQLIVLRIFMSRELFHIELKMKINCFCFMSRGGNKFTFLSLIHLHMCYVSLPMGNWTVCFLFTLVDIV